MKKIKYIKQLKQEKKKLQQHSEVLEEKIRRDWYELKANLRPQTVAKEAFVKWADRQTETNNSDSILASTLSYGASLLAKKFSVKAGAKFGELFKKKS